MALVPLLWFRLAGGDCMYLVLWTMLTRTCEWNLSTERHTASALAVPYDGFAMALEVRVNLQSRLQMSS